MHHHMTPQMQECIQNCLDCHKVCLQEAMNHCLETGGEHTEPSHFRLMMACAEICQASANIMLIGSELHPLTCGVCAEICTRCADDCERMGDMEECAVLCRQCAHSCREMAGAAV